MLEDNGLKEFVDNDIQKSTISYTQNLTDWNKCVAKVRRTILEVVRDHIVSNIHGKETSYAI